MFSKNQLLIAEFYDISYGNIKKFLSNFLDKEEYVLHYENFIWGWD